MSDAHPDIFKLGKTINFVNYLNFYSNHKFPEWYLHSWKVYLISLVGKLHGIVGNCNGKIG